VYNFYKNSNVLVISEFFTVGSSSIVFRRATPFGCLISDL
jgi:hypothetical protein